MIRMMVVTMIDVPEPRDSLTTRYRCPKNSSRIPQWRPKNSDDDGDDDCYDDGDGGDDDDGDDDNGDDDGDGGGNERLRPRL